MSTIAGLWNWSGRGGAGEDLVRMQAALAPFGRDQAGGWDGGAVALGSRLSRLLPEDDYDRQPLIGGGGRFVLVADLRLDNRPELAAALGVEPARAAGMADADMLLLAWERWTLATPSRLLGDFAFAVWDREQRALHLVRDALGQRPIFVTRQPGRIAFASLYPGLHALPGVARGADLDAVRAYAARLPEQGTGSFHIGIDRVEPGTRLTVHADGRETVDRWWDFPAPERLRLRRGDDYADLYRETFDRCVRDRLRARGPVASHLSAGLDSSAVTTTAAAILAERGEGLSAYTAVPMADAPLHAPPGRIIDESALAALTAARFPNIRHELVGRDGRAIGEDLPGIFETLNQPVRNLCNWTWILDIQRRMQARGERVLLTATYGNVTVSPTAGLMLPERLATGHVAGVMGDILFGDRNGASRKGHAYAAIGPLLPRALDSLIRRAAGQSSPARLPFSPLSAGGFEAMVAAERGRRPHDPTYFDPNLRWRATVHSVMTQMDPGPFHKMHLAGQGVDQRDPCRDQRLLRLILAMPPEIIGSGGETRRLYRRVFAPRVPETVYRTPTVKGLQTADWSYRVARGRRQLSQVIETAARIEPIAEMFDVPGLRADIADGPDHAVANDAGYAMRRRWRFLHGIACMDFASRAGAP